MQTQPSVAADENELLTAAQVAKLLKVSARKLYDLSSPRGSLSCVRLGPTLIRYRRADVNAWVQSQVG